MSSERDAQTAEQARHCVVVAVDRPNVWHDGEQWQCDQSTRCLTCNAVDFRRLAPDDASWDDAFAASLDALPYPPNQELSAPDERTGGPAITHMHRPPPREPATRPACYGDPRFTTTDPVDAMEAAEICRTLCTFRVCRTILRELTDHERANREGTWDGALYVGGRRREGKRGAA